MCIQKSTCLLLNHPILANMTFAVHCCHSELGLWRDSTLVCVSATALLYPISILLYPKMQCFWNVQLRRIGESECMCQCTIFIWTCISYHLHCQSCCWGRCHSIGNITMVIVPTGVPSTLNKKCPWGLPSHCCYCPSCLWSDWVQSLIECLFLSTQAVHNQGLCIVPLLVNIEMYSECKSTPQVEEGKGKRETSESVQQDGESMCIVCLLAVPQ